MSNGNKNTIFVEANVMNISANVSALSPNAFRVHVDDFLILFFKFNFLVAIATNQIQRFGQK